MDPNHEMKEHWMSVTIGIDPHKSTHTAVAVDRDIPEIQHMTLADGLHASPPIGAVAPSRGSSRSA